MIQLVIYYAINVKYILVTKKVIKQMGRNFSGELFIGVLYTTKTSAIIIFLSLFRTIVPLEWREWWFNEIVVQFPAYHNSILIADQKSILMDKTKDLESWNEGIKFKELSYIADVCNQFILPSFICPWV